MSCVHPKPYSCGFRIEVNRNELYPSKARFPWFSHWIWWAMSSEQSKLFSFWILIGFDKKWAISIQGHILRDFVLKSIRNEQYPAKARFLYFHGIWWGMSTTQSKLFSYWFLIGFIEKWFIFRQGYTLEDFVLKSIRNELYPSTDSFWRFYDWIWWEMSSEQSKACCYWFLNVSNENWAVSSQDNNLKDF